MSSNENLQAAFAGESQANRRYLAFAQRAENDGFPQVAKLFRAAAEAETVHALAHFRAMDGLKGTEQNLKVAIEGEAYEFQKMYPEFLAAAQEEGHKRAEISFKNALAVEEVHHGLYSEALKAVQSGRDLPNSNLHVCAICGHTIMGGSAPAQCPVCGAPGERFFEVT
jgi:rubrerythrin